MRYAAAEKLEIIRIVEQSHLPVQGPWPRLYRGTVLRQSVAPVMPPA
jgi:hypothetical protein